MSNAEQTLGSVKEALAGLLAQTRGVSSFVLKGEIKEMIKRMAAAIREGKVAEATELGQEALKAGRNLFGAFLHRSAVDRVEDGVVVKTSHFSNIISALRADKFEEDLLDRLETRRAELVAVIKTETNGDFSGRIDAYLAMTAAVNAVEAEQLQRDNEYRDAQEKARMLAKRGKQAAAEAADKARDENQRAQIIAQREKDADDILALI